MKIGDKIRVRKYKDMLKKYGEIRTPITYKVAIDIPLWSTKEMKEFCGGIFEITKILEIEWGQIGREITIKGYTLKGLEAYLFSGEMLENYK